MVSATAGPTDAHLAVWVFTFRKPAFASLVFRVLRYCRAAWRFNESIPRYFGTASLHPTGAMLAFSKLQFTHLCRDFWLPLYHSWQKGFPLSKAASCLFQFFRASLSPGFRRLFFVFIDLIELLHLAILFCSKQLKQEKVPVASKG